MRTPARILGVGFWGLLNFFGHAFAEQVGFIKNNGQVFDQFGVRQNEVRYTLPFSGGLIHLTDHGFVYDLRQPQGIVQPDEATFNLDYHRIEVKFEGGRTPSWQPDRPMFQQHFYMGEQGQFKTLVYERVLCVGLYPGIDVEFLSTANGFKYNVIVDPGASLNVFKFKILGHDGALSVKNGALQIPTRFGVLEERIPISLIHVNGHSTPIDVQCLLSENGLITFHCPDWDGQNPLVIDPIPHLLWSTYLGGPLLDQVEAIDTDPDGNIYVAGFSQSAVNIATTGSYQGTLVGAVNCFLVKYLTNGSKEWGTYFGGGQGDRCYAISYFDPTALYMAITTFSPGLATIGANQTQINGADDMLIARFDDTGNLLWATYHGGNDHDFPSSLVTSPSGDLYITGHTRSVNNIATPGAFDPTFDGAENAFLLKFSQWGTPLWGTYFGNLADRAEGIGRDGTGNIYIAGSTASTTGVSGGTAPGTSYQGQRDGFVASFTSNGSFRWGRYFGGPAMEDILGMVVSESGNATIVGNTESSDLATPNAHQTQMASIDEGIIAHFNTNGNLLWSTYFGGDGVEYLHDIKADAEGNLVIAGMSESSGGITSAEAFQPDRVAMYDAFVAEFTANGQFRWGTFYGGEADEQVNALAIDPRHGHILIGGLTQSTTAMATSGALQTGFSGGLHDGFVARLCEPIIPQLSINQGPWCLGDVVQVSVLNAGAFSSINWAGLGVGPQLNYPSTTVGELPITALVVDTNACPIARSVEALVNPIPEPDITSVGPWLAGTEAMFETSPMYSSYVWAPLSSNGPQLNYTPTNQGADSVCVTVTDNLGCMGTSCFVFTVEAPNGMPQPSAPALHQGALVVRDLAGKVVYTGNWADLTQLSPGMYVVTWSAGTSAKVLVTGQ